MARAKRITAAAIEKAVGYIDNNKDTIVLGEGENQVEITIKKRLSLYERGDMVESIASMMWSEDDEGNRNYAPYLRKIAYDFNILNYFTNIELPASAERVWEFVDGTNVASIVVDNVGRDYIGSIIQEAEEMVAYRRELSMKRSKIDEILDAANSLFKTLGDAAEKSDLGTIIGALKEHYPELGDQLNQILNSQEVSLQNQV